MPRPVMLKKLKLNGSNENLQDLLELTPQKDVFFIIGDWNTKEQILIAAIFISPY